METRTQTLINHYLAGTATDDQVRELDQLLQEDEAARQAMIKASWIDGALFKVCRSKKQKTIEEDLPTETQEAIEAQEEFWAQTGRSIARPISRRRMPHPSRIAAVLLGAILIGAMATGGYYATRPQSVAKVIVHDQATFAMGRSIEIGDTVRAGDEIDLQSGRLTLRFEKGAMVDLQGPASLQVIDDNGGYLLSGRLLATVPPAGRGFTIQTNQLNAIDYGTVFGVNARSDGRVEVHVFSGEVDAEIPAQNNSKDQTSSSYRLTRQQALHVSETGKAKRTPASAVPFGDVARWHTGGLRTMALRSTFGVRTYTIPLTGPSVKWVSAGRYRGASPVQGEDYTTAKSNVFSDRTDHYWLLIEDQVNAQGRPAGDLDFEDVQIEVRTQKHNGYDLVTLRLFRGTTSIVSRLVDETGADLLNEPIPRNPDTATYRFKVPRTGSTP